METLACSVRTPVCNGKKANTFTKSTANVTELGDKKTPTNESPTTLAETSGSSSGTGGADALSDNGASPLTAAVGVVASGLVTFALGLLLE